MVENLFLMILLIICLYSDLKYRKIYNKFTFSAMLLGLFFHALSGGFTGLKFSLYGLLAGLMFFFLPFVLGGVGAGDVKLMGAIGALKGAGFVVSAGLATAVVGGLVAIIVLAKRKQVLIVTQRIWRSLFFSFITRFKVNFLATLDQSEYHQAFPYGVAVFAGTVITLVTGWRVW